MFYVSYKYAKYSILCFKYTKKLLYLLTELSLFCIAILLLVWDMGVSGSVFGGSRNYAEMLFGMVNSSSGVL